MMDSFQLKGAEIVEAGNYLKYNYFNITDLKDLESLKRATSGVDVVISALNSDGLANQENLLKAVKETGVKRFVPSEFGSDIDKWQRLSSMI